MGIKRVNQSLLNILRTGITSIFQGIGLKGSDSHSSSKALPTSAHHACFPLHCSTASASACTPTYNSRPTVIINSGALVGTTTQVSIAYVDFAKDPTQGLGWAQVAEIEIFGDGVTPFIYDEGRRAFSVVESEVFDRRCGLFYDLCDMISFGNAEE